MRASVFSWICGVALLLAAVADVSAQALGEVQPATAGAPPRSALWSGPAPPPSIPALPAVTVPALQEEARRSALRTLSTHALVGTGAGLLIGWAMSGANLSGDDASLVLIWGSVGLGAGLVSGTITWLTGRPRGGG